MHLPSRDRNEDDLVEERIGPVEPGEARVWPPRQLSLEPVGRADRTSCSLADDELPAGWLERFPSGAEIVHKAIELRPHTSLPIDERLLRRRECEYELFLSVERAVELPRVTAGFATVDDFVARANSILQRRKSRAGRSLELHTRHIFAEEGLTENHDFSFQPESEPGKRPDFLFPSQAAYQDAGFPADRLRILAVKTTCRDRWRQVMAEADRVPAKHLLTVQEGVSENQFREMTDAGVQLVVPAGLTAKYPKSVRPHLQTLESFIGDVRLLTP